MSATMRIKKGDMVQIIAGKDKGKSGKIIAINHKKGVVYVEGLNMITKHTKPSMANPVSYTHLDVYKRQSSQGGWPS